MKDDVAGGGDTQDCRYCGEEIKAAAKKCRYCGEFPDAGLRSRQRERTSGPAPVPLGLKIYGVIIMGLACLGILSGVINVILAPPSFRGRIAGVFFVQLLFQVIILRLGLGLWRGQRSAVIGLCVIAGIGVLAGVAILAMAGGSGGATAGIVVIGVVAVIYGPPIAIGFASWKKLT